MGINSLVPSRAIEVRAFDIVVFVFVTGDIKPKQPASKGIYPDTLLFSVIHFVLSLGKFDFDENGNKCLKRG
jgi:hypothetical protein